MKFQTSNGHTVEIDDADAAMVSGYAWYAERRNGKTWYAKATRSKGGKTVNFSMHRLLLGAKTGEQIDHRDGNGLNNRRDNLRIATQQQNCWNRGKRKTENSTSRFVGVTWHPRAKGWRAMIQQSTIGYYLTQEDAALAYDREAENRYGEFARLNFPGDTRVPIPKPKPPEGRFRNGSKTSKFYGVSWHKRDRRWRAQCGGRYFGSFLKEEDAREAVIKARGLVQKAA